MRRREFITLAGSAIAGSSRVARAQEPERVRRVVVLMGSAETVSARGWLTTFAHRLEELGWREHYNLFTQVQWWNDRPEQMRSWAAELISGSPDVAVTFTNLALEVMKPIAGGVPVDLSASAMQWAGGLSRPSRLPAATPPVLRGTMPRWARQRV